MALHPLRRMRCKLQVETPSDYTYLLFWAELSRHRGEKIPVAIVGLEPGTPGSVVQCFNHLATKQPIMLAMWFLDGQRTICSYFMQTFLHKHTILQTMLHCKVRMVAGLWSPQLHLSVPPPKECVH